MFKSLEYNFKEHSGNSAIDLRDMVCDMIVLVKLTLAEAFGSAPRSIGGLNTSKYAMWRGVVSS